mmetsp:Transcript_39897/g.94649  ORF Transcript_39897/g.94649 Transcript_39897/m.94649 type:complete len:237 (-) Transcript_39897:323-1033(-)
MALLDSGLHRLDSPHDELLLVARVLPHCLEDRGAHPVQNVLHLDFEHLHGRPRDDPRDQRARARAPEEVGVGQCRDHHRVLLDFRVDLHLEIRVYLALAVDDEVAHVVGVGGVLIFLFPEPVVKRVLFRVVEHFLRAATLAVEDLLGEEKGDDELGAQLELAPRRKVLQILDLFLDRIEVPLDVVLGEVLHVLLSWQPRQDHVTLRLHGCRAGLVVDEPCLAERVSGAETSHGNHV